MAKWNNCQSCQPFQNASVQDSKEENSKPFWTHCATSGFLNKAVLSLEDNCQPQLAVTKLTIFFKNDFDFHLDFLFCWSSSSLTSRLLGSSEIDAANTSVAMIIESDLNCGESWVNEVNTFGMHPACHICIPHPETLACCWKAVEIFLFDLTPNASCQFHTSKHQFWRSEQHTWATRVEEFAEWTNHCHPAQKTFVESCPHMPDAFMTKSKDVEKHVGSPLLCRERGNSAMLMNDHVWDQPDVKPHQAEVWREGFVGCGWHQLPRLIKPGKTPISPMFKSACNGPYRWLVHGRHAF